MSMLTPPGMGGKYRITGNSYPRMRRPRRRRRIAVTTVAVAVGLGVLSWGTVQLIDVYTGGGDTVRAAAARGCERDGGASARPTDKPGQRPGATGKGTRPGPGAYPEPSAVTVNVYNATTRSGLAKKTADTLKKRGFRIGEVTNAPASLDKKVKEAGLLMGPPSAHRTGAFDVLATQLPGARVKAVDRKGDEIDLVIGKAFRSLAEEKDARRALAALASPSPSPSPSRC
ncbi:MAG TPA: LytR C-terminal domain-containing protein [Streptomyces sp.]|uniref:LytR C-terminal domain-containing protein n=1 Tax=Streptomyces sp. TaxID=1931 RepID=UPI002D390FD8|nr:LytR C-terminal domain-containing protein [Streptomyces sp.]HZG04316.1 LytR C-terminal domain-containing protein [Streptomyces sp.]